MKLRILAAIAISAVTLAAYSSTAHAYTAVANAIVTINYNGACTLTTGSPTMTYIAGTDVSISADVTVNCNGTQAWALTADKGLNVLGSLRRGTLGGQTLTYRLYSDVGLVTEITAALAANDFITGTGNNGAAQIIPAYYAVKSADNGTLPTVFGAFTDTLGYTLTF